LLYYFFNQGEREMDDRKMGRMRFLKELAFQGHGLSEKENQELAELRYELKKELEGARAGGGVRESMENQTADNPIEQFTCTCVPGARSASVNTQSRRPTFREAMSRAAKQVSLDGFTQIAGNSLVMGADYQLAKTLCMVMAEVYMAEPSYVVYCCGVQMPAEQVQAVYSELTGDHIECLIRKIKKSRGKAVKYQRPYLRTMLYNAVFELEAQTQAGMDADLWEI
jgi:hypothetical protein